MECSVWKWEQNLLIILDIIPQSLKAAAFVKKSIRDWCSCLNRRYWPFRRTQPHLPVGSSFLTLIASYKVVTLVWDCDLHMGWHADFLIVWFDLLCITSLIVWMMGIFMPNISKLHGIYFEVRKLNGWREMTCPIIRNFVGPNL